MVKISLEEFQKHVDAMTDDEVRASIQKAEAMTAGLNQDGWTILPNELDLTFKDNK